ncbi:MAG: cadherin-like domain-containing protein, partial [Oceanospirillaceae bacterium]
SYQPVITLTAADDVDIEGVEAFSGNIATADTNVLITTSTAAASIKDEDGQNPDNPREESPVLAISTIKAQATEGEVDDNTVTFEVVRTGSTEQDVTFDFTLGESASSSLEASDITSISYVDAAGDTQTVADIAAFLAGTAPLSITIPAGSSYQPVITLTAADDVDIEGVEAFSGNIATTDTNVIITTASADASIQDGNSAPDAVDDYGKTSTFGLKSEYYAYEQDDNNGRPNLEHIAQIEAYIASNGPDATFVAKNIFYNVGVDGAGKGIVGTGNLGGDNNSNDGKTNLQTFLGADAASLSVTDPAQGSDVILKMQGLIELEAGAYTFKVRADDGYSIKIDGKIVAIVDRIQSPATGEHEFSLADGGLHKIEIIYWDQGGAYIFEPTISKDGGSFEKLSTYDLQVGYNTPENQPLTFTFSEILDNDTDPENDVLSVTGVSPLATDGNGNVIGSVVFNPTQGSTLGNIVFTPNDNYFGPAQYEYTITDGNGGTDTATVFLTVTPVNELTDGDETRIINEGSIVEGTIGNGGLLDNTVDTDGPNNPSVVSFIVAGDPLTHVVDGSPLDLGSNIGILTIQSNGEYQFVPAAGFSGVVPLITYDVTDGFDTDKSTLQINVTAVNDAPIATDDTVNDATGNTKTINVLTHGDVDDSDPDGELAVDTVKLVGAGPDGSLVVAGEGVWTVDDLGNVTFKAQLGYSGSPTPIKYTVADNEGLVSNQANIDINFANGLVDVKPTGTNLALMLDVSGSMNAKVNSTQTRLDFAKSAIASLLTTYSDESTYGEVKVKIATFNTDIRLNTGWMSITDALVVLGAIVIPDNLSTNYDVAIEEIKTAFSTGDPVQGGKNVSYFLSDGEPNSPRGSAGLDDSEEAAWQTFLSSEGIVSHAIGLNLDSDALDPIAYDGIVNAGDGDAALPINVENLNNLEATLQNTIVTPSGKIYTGTDGNDDIVGSAVNDQIFSGLGDDILSGGDGDDLLFAGLGNDTMTGGAGADTFKLLDSDINDITKETDTILDFNTVDGDKLDLSDLLNTSGTAANLDQYLNFESQNNGADTLVHINKDGDFGSGGKIDHTILLEGVSFAGSSDQDIINQLLSNNNLLTE